AWFGSVSGAMLSRPHGRESMARVLSLFSASGAQAWVIAIGAGLVLLAVATGAIDPYRPNWPCGLVLAVSALAGALAVWTQRGAAVYASGLLFNVAGILIWLAWIQTGGLNGFYCLVWNQALCLAI